MNTSLLPITLQIILLIAFLNIQARLYAYYAYKRVHRGLAMVADWLGMTGFGVYLLAMQLYVAFVPFAFLYAILVDDRIYKLRAWAYQRRHPNVSGNEQNRA